MFRNILTATFLVLLLAGCKEEGLTLDVPAGEMAEIEIPEIQTPGGISFALSLDKLHATSQWAPYASFRLYEGSGENSFRLSLTHSPSNNEIVSLVEYYREGETIIRESRITKIPLGAKVAFSLKWQADGTINHQTMHGKWETLSTHLANPKASVTFSSATASYYPDGA